MIDLVRGAHSKCSRGNPIKNRDDVGSIFEDTLEEEKTADLKLTNIAESFVNEEAAAEGRGRDLKRVSARPSRQAAADRKQ